MIGGTVQFNTTNSTGTTTIAVTSAVTGATDVLNLVISNSGDVYALATVAAANVETININANDSVAAGSAATINTATLSAAALTTLTVSGNNGLTLTNTTEVAVTSFDASGVVANNTVAAANVAATTDSLANLAVTYTSANLTTTASTSITGGAGNDTLTGAAAKDTINGGGGDDIISGLAGTDIINGGAGADTITFTNEVGVSDTMTGGAGSDIFTMANTTAATQTAHIITDIDFGTSTTLVDKINVDISATIGLTVVTDLVDTSAVTVANSNGTVVALGTDGATIASADLVVIDTATYADTTAMLAGLKTAGASTITYGASLTDNDAFYIAYSDGTDGYLAVAVAGSANLATSEGVDSVTNMIKLTGVSLADLATLDSTDFFALA